MKALKKKHKIIIVVVAVVAVVFVLLTTVGKPLLSKSITAEKLDDFKNVCYNNKITNASDYSTPDKAVIAAFYERPVSEKNPWTNVTAASEAYYAKYAEFEKANVVACFEYQPFAGKQIATCENDIKLKSAHYKTIFYEAKTGKKISEGKEIVNDDPTCPSVYVYGKVSKETAKAPNPNLMHEAIAEFVN